MGNIRVLLIISGSVAAYKALDLARRLRERECAVTGILTKGGQEFITPLAVSSLTGAPTYTDLFSLKDEVEMGHIRLSREADLIVVAPASADIIAKMANGLTDDLATATLLASDKPVLVAPAMNARMWAHPATRRNLNRIREDGAIIIPPASGELACGEVGQGRMAEVEEIVEAIFRHCERQRSNPETGSPRLLTQARDDGPLNGLTALVTAGPTQEPLDPVRYLSNRSSGKQGYAIAETLRDAGASVTLVSGLTALPRPGGVTFIQAQTAEEMLAACKAALPADIAVCTAAVADWKAAKPLPRKMKKRENGGAPEIKLTANPDILHTLAALKKQRPTLVIGFAAETEDLKKNARKKLKDKGCDAIVANNVSEGQVFGQEMTSAILLTSRSVPENWQNITKQELAQRLVKYIAQYFSTRHSPNFAQRNPRGIRKSLDRPRIRAANSGDDERSTSRQSLRKRRSRA